MEKKIKKSKLTAQDIKKYSNIEKEHVITKIKRHERLYTFYTVILFIGILLGTTLLIGTSFKYIASMNSYNSGNLLVEYTSVNNVIGNVITLTDQDIIEDAKIKDNHTYTFTITNTSNVRSKYAIKIYRDDEFIKLDNCRDKLFKDTQIKYNINNGSIFYLHTKKEKDSYTLIEDTIPANSTKVYSLNIWVDKDTLQNDRHYHGLIEVDTIK